ncbi:putative xyloglucan endotransglucosylase/hydrolase protein 27, partial [Sarracenia purpurea var. burkii]
SGFVSQDLYLHGFFSASIKLPADYTAGVVVAFYMSNGDMYEKSHDEVDFEFLGNIRGKDWRIQTNVYGNGSTNIGREERYGLWFDPSEDFHQYSILWTQTHIIFFIDNVPIREIKRTEAMGGDFPSKPMSLYATIWDGSDWATNGGRYRVNYKYAPYIAEFSDFVLHGCAVDPIDHSSKCDATLNSNPILTSVTPEQRAKMENFRKKHMQYSYCYDRARYKVPPPECVVDPQEADHLRWFDPVTFGGARRHHGKRHHRSRSSRAEATAI